jgi:hypothetical protein
MNKAKVIELLEKALESSEELYSKVGEGEITFSEAGDAFHTYLGDEVFEAISKALVYLKRDDKE